MLLYDNSNSFINFLWICVINSSPCSYIKCTSYVRNNSSSFITFWGICVINSFWSYILCKVILFFFSKGMLVYYDFTSNDIIAQPFGISTFLICFIKCFVLLIIFMAAIILPNILLKYFTKVLLNILLNIFQIFCNFANFSVPKFVLSIIL